MTTDTKTEVDNLTDVIPYEEPTDGADTKTHIVSPPENKHLFQPGMEAQDIVDLARATGQEVIALCGYRWVPKHNPDKFETCDACFKIAGDIMRGEG